MDTAEFTKRLVAGAAGMGRAFSMGEYEGRIARTSPASYGTRPWRGGVSASSRCARGFRPTSARDWKRACRMRSWWMHRALWRASVS